MQASSFRMILSLQLLLLLYDILNNALIDLVVPEYDVQLVLFILQDIGLMFQLIVVSLEFFNTYASQAGFVGVMVKKFRTTIIITVFYLALSIGLHVWTLTLRWNRTGQFVYVWGIGGYYALYIIQRGLSPFYYYYYKRTALKLGDSKFYYNSEWLRSQWSGAR
ncbi:transmembrane protein 138-like [Styela clava]